MRWAIRLTNTDHLESTSSCILPLSVVEGSIALGLLVRERTNKSRRKKCFGVRKCLPAAEFRAALRHI